MLRRASAIENNYLSSLVAASRVANALATIVVTSVQGELPARRQHRRGICRWLLLVCDDYCLACFALLSLGCRPSAIAGLRD